MGLVREILLRIEDESYKNSRSFTVEGFPEVQVNYNLDLLIAEGLVNGKGSWAIDGETYWVNIRGLTWQGHDFLDSIRDQSVWTKVQDKATVAGHNAATLTLDMVKALATSVIKSDLGI